MDFLTMTGREYSTRTGATFTVRSANSLSYSLDRKSLRNSRCLREEEESKDRYGIKTEPANYYQSGTYSRVKGQSFEREKLTLKPNRESAQVKSTEYVSGQARNSERQGRTEWRSASLSSRSRSLDWRAGAKSPERKLCYRADTLRRTGDLTGAEGSRVRSTVQAYNNEQLNKAKGHSLPSRLVSASLGPKGGQSILERIEKLYGASEFGNTGDYKTTEPQMYYKDCLGDSIRRRFSSGEHRQSSGQSRESVTWTTSKDASTSISPGINRTRTLGQWQIQANARQFEGTTFQNTGFSDIGTRSLDRARSRSSVAARIRAARAAEEMEKPGQPDTFLKGISEVSSSADKCETSKDVDRKNWSRMTVKERNPVRKEEIKDQAEDKYRHEKTWIKRESTSDDVFESLEKLKSIEKKPINDKSALTLSVRNKINQFEALTQRAQTSSPRRAFSVPEHMSKTCDRVQRSSSAKTIGAAAHRRGGQREEPGQGVMENQTFLFEREKNLQQDKTRKEEITVRTIWVDESKTKKGTEKELQNTSSMERNAYSQLKTKLELPLKDPPPTINVINIDETDFSKIASPETEVDASSSSEVSTPTSDNDKTPTNTPDSSPLPSPITHPEKTPHFAPVNKPLDISPPLVTNLPDLVSRDDLNGKKPVLDLNAWLDGLKPQVTAWSIDGEDDDDSTQKDEDSNYDSDSGESSVTITSNKSNKSFSVSLADLCNFAGADYDSENDSDEWQSSGRRSASLSSDISGFSYVSVLPTEELDKLIEDVKSIGDNNLQDYEDVHVVVLHKDIGVGLGFSLAGGVDQNKPVTVHKVFHSGVAAQEGSIKEGDQVLSINGTALSGFAHWEALRVLRRSKGREMGVVVLKKPDARTVSNGRALSVNQAPAPSQTSTKDQCITVILEKSDRDLGFSLEGGVGSTLGNKPLSVQKIFQGGPVNKILPGDEVLEVNGVSVVGMRRLEAWTLIRNLPPGPVSVLLQRQPLMHKI